MTVGRRKEEVGERVARGSPAPGNSLHKRPRRDTNIGGYVGCHCVEQVKYLRMYVRTNRYLT